MSFTRICATFLTFAAVAQAALEINQVSIVGNGTSFVVFSSTDPENDPASCTVELINEAFNSQFAVGNNVPSTIGNFTFQTPGLNPGPGYSLQLVNNSNINQIFAMTGQFTIAENDVTSSTSKPSTSATPTLPPSGSSVSSTPVATIQSITPSGVTSQSGSSSSSGSSASSSSTAPPSTSSNPVFPNSASGLQASLGLLLVGIAFAFL